MPPLRSVVLNIVKENSRGKGVLGWLSGARAAYEEACRLGSANFL